MEKAVYHLPGLFEFYDFYRKFLPIYRENTEYFYDWCQIGSLYGAPADCLWAGGRVSTGNADPRQVLALTEGYGLSARLTFSNSLLRPEHLSDPRCNRLCRLLAESPQISKAGVAFKKGTHMELIQQINRQFEELTADGTIAKIVEKYGLDANFSVIGGGINEK